MKTLAMNELRKNGIDFDDEFTMVFAYTKKEWALSEKILKFYGFGLKLFMPGSKVDDKAYELEIKEKSDEGKNHKFTA